MNCPTCSKELKQRSQSEGYSYFCESCGGEMFHIAVLKNMRISSDMINEFWKKSHSSQKKEGRKCPHCKSHMFLHYPSDPNVKFSLEVCSKDSYVWLDKGKVEQLPLDVEEVEAIADKSLQAIKLLELEEQRFKNDLNNKLENAQKSKKALIGFIPGAVIGMLICLWISAKAKIFTTTDLTIIVIMGAIIGGAFGYFLIGRVLGNRR